MGKARFVTSATERMEGNKPITTPLLISVHVATTDMQKATMEVWWKGLQWLVGAVLCDNCSDGKRGQRTMLFYGLPRSSPPPSLWAVKIIHNFYWRIQLGEKKGWKSQCFVSRIVENLSSALTLLETI